MGSFGGSDIFAGGATGYEAGFYHEGGEARPGKNLRRVSLVTMHSGREVPAMLEADEFVHDRMTTARWGAPALAAMKYGIAPNVSGSSGGGAPQVNNFQFHGVQDMDSFKRSKSTMFADLSRAVDKGRKHR